MAFSTAITGLKAATTELDVTGNNIANASTVGFKSGRTEFADIFSTVVVGSGSANSAGSGVIVSDIAQDFTAGTIQFTNNNLDLAIDGSGFFQLNDGQGGITYTRAGGFELDKEGRVVSKSGNFLQGFGLDAAGNMQPIGNLAVTQKESPPKATEIMGLAFNVDFEAKASSLAYDPSDSATYTFSTTNRTFDSLGNENTVKFDFIKQGPWRERQNVTFSNFAAVAGDTLAIAGANFAVPADGTAFVVDGVSYTVPVGGPDQDLAAALIVNEFRSGTLQGQAGWDLNIKDMKVGSGVPAELIVTYKASASDTRPVIVEHNASDITAAIKEDPFFSAKREETTVFDTTGVPLPAGYPTGDKVVVGGVDISIAGFTSQAEIVDAIIKDSNKILAANPQVDTIGKNAAGDQLVITFKPELGDNPTLSITETAAALTATTSGTEIGDATYQGVYQMHAVFNNETFLDIGRGPQPGSGGTTTEPGPILVTFDTSNGLLKTVNGVPVSATGQAPKISMVGADPAKPLDDIELDLSDSTQYASVSIVKNATQDGYTKGDLIGVTFAPDGTMVASFSNGQDAKLGRVALATFENQSGLQPVGNTAWSATLASGQAIVNPPGAGLNGQLRSAALEQSNVNLSEQLVKLIEAQRNFQANSKTLQTENAITQNILQIS